MTARAGTGPAGAPPPENLSVPALLDTAAQQVGHADWGDLAFTEPLGLLIDSCQETLSATGRRVLRSVALRHLRNRLYVRAEVARRPSAREAPITAPIVVTGLPRTGTSLLQNLLAADGRHRFLHLWEALHPVPPGGDGPDEATLVAQAERWLERFYAIAPDFRTIHPLTPRGPEECDALLQNAFASQHFVDMFDAPAYAEWFYRGTLEREYGFYALQLKVLTRDGGQRWLLKSPGHFGHLEELFGVLPDAVVVHCHRDPLEAVPSYASLIATVRRPNTDAVSERAVGEQALRRCVTMLERALAVRDTVGDERFVDVAYPSLVGDPIGVVRTIYDRVGMRPLPAAEAAMRRWLAAHPSDRHGVHRYDLQRFGLRADRLRAAFADYHDSFAPLLAG